MTADEALRLIEDHRIEAVSAGTPDIDGVFVGKRLTAKQFVNGLEDGISAADAIFAFDIEQDVVRGYPLAGVGPQSAFGDIVLRPDISTFRIVPWDDGVASVICDSFDAHGAPIEIAPRAVLRRVIERASGLGFEAETALEFEFRIFRESAASLYAKDFANLDPVGVGGHAYRIAQANVDDPIVGDVQRQMNDYGVEVEGYNREHSEGLWEMNLHHARALEAADRGLLFKSGMKEILGRRGYAATFMAKYHERISGASGHTHMSLWRGGANAFWDAASEHHASQAMSSFIAGVLDTLPAFTALYAPNLNSYRRFARGGLVGEHVGWGIDNRTMAVRALTHGPSAIRIEARTPGADVNPYLAIAGVLAGGISGIERGLVAPPPEQRNAYGIEGAARVPATLDEAIDAFEQSEVARDCFGDAFVSHYVSMRRWEIDKGRRAVTEWERRRYFEQV